MNIEQVGKLYHEILEGPDEQKIAKIAETGIHNNVIRQYLRIYDLPEEIKGLLRSSNERTQEQEEFLKRFKKSPTGELSPKRAVLLTELGDLSKEEMMEVGLLIVNMKMEVARKFVRPIDDKYPKYSVRELRDMTYEEEYQKHPIGFRLDHRLNEALEQACTDRQIRYQDLLTEILGDWLKKNNYLE